jgi:ABC-type multidrug transport system ATPase subunit
MHGLNVAMTMRRLNPLIIQLRLLEDIINYAEDYSRGMKKKLGLLLNPPMDWTWNRRIFSTI